MTAFPVFDVHAHVYPDELAPKATAGLHRFYGDLEIHGKGTFAELAAHSAACGVRGFLLLAVATNAHQVPHVNDFAAKTVAAARRAGFLAAGFAGMHQDFPDPAGELERAVSLGLSGVKIHPDIQGVNLDDPRFFPLYAALEEKGLPVCFHMGDNRAEYVFSRTERLLALTGRFPRLRVIAAHLGGYRAWEHVQALAACPNVWFDASSTMDFLSPEEEERLIRALGVSRVMFGTDYPVRSVREELPRFLALPGLTDEEKKAILYDNAIGFLGL